MKYLIITLFVLDFVACGQPEVSPPPVTPQAAAQAAEPGAPKPGAKVVSELDCAFSDADGRGVQYRVDFVAKTYDDGGFTQTCEVRWGDVRNLDCVPQDVGMNRVRYEIHATASAWTLQWPLALSGATPGCTRTL